MPAVHVKRVTVDRDAIDVHRHVNNQEYLRWMQEAAIEHSTAQGWPMARYLEMESSWYVKSHFIDYLRPALLGDDILIVTRVSGMNERNSPRQTLFLRESDRQMLARAETQWIFVSLRSSRPVAIPAELRSAFDIVETETDALATLDIKLASRRSNNN